MRAGQIENRLAQLGCAADRFIHGIEAGNAPEEDVPLSGYTDGVKHDPAEQECQQQIIHLIPVHPVRLRRRLNRRGDYTIVIQHDRHGHDIDGPVLEFDALAVLQRELVLIPSRRPRPPGPLGFADIVLVRRKFGHDFHRSRIRRRGPSLSKT